MTEESRSQHLKDNAHKQNSKSRVPTVEKLPANILRAARALNNQNPDTGKLKKQQKGRRDLYHHNSTDKENHNTIELLESLTTQQRTAVFEIFFGEIAPMVETAWLHSTTQVYQTGWQARAFRAPKNETYHREQRINWLTSLKKLCDKYKFTPENLPNLTLSLNYQAAPLTPILISQIDHKTDFGNQILEQYIDIIYDENSGQSMSHHLIPTLLTASNPKGWEAIEKLLLAAQRQEGLRQSIIDAVDLAHPQAFLRMIDLILDHNLLRFSSIARGIDVWFAQEWDAQSFKTFRDILTNIKQFLTSPKAALQATESNTPQTVYFGLWAMAFYDIELALPKAKELLAADNEKIRFATSTFLRLTRCTASSQIAATGLKDKSLPVFLQNAWVIQNQPKTDFFEILTQRLKALPSKQINIPPTIWPWTARTLEASSIADLIVHHSGQRSILEIAPFRDQMSPYGRAALVEKLAKSFKTTADTNHYKLLLDCIKDRSPDVVNTVFKKLKKLKIDETGSLVIEALLTRKAANLRRSSLRLLLAQDDPQALASYKRLLTSKNAAQRLAGVELAGQLIGENRKINEVKQTLLDYKKSRKILTKDETALLTLALQHHQEKHTYQNALGLCDPATIKPPIIPQAAKVTTLTNNTSALIISLNQWVKQRSEIEVELTPSYQGSTTERHLFGNIKWGWPTYSKNKSHQENLALMPFGAQLIDWYVEFLSTNNDKDGLTLFRAHLKIQQETSNYSYWNDKFKVIIDNTTIEHYDHVSSLITWILEQQTYTPQHIDTIIDYAIADTGNYIKEELNSSGYSKSLKKRTEISHGPGHKWETALHGTTLSDQQFTRLFELHRWYWRPTILQNSETIPLTKLWNVDAIETTTLLRAIELNLIDSNELTYLLAGKSPTNEEENLSTFRSFCTRKPNKEWLKHPSYPALLHLSQKIQTRILEVEMERGDLKQITSPEASGITFVEGSEYFIKFATIIGNNNLVRQYQWGEGSYAKASVFSSLLRASTPTNHDSHEKFSKLATASKISKERFIDLAMFAPQWAKHIEAHVQYHGLENAVWWIHAHTKDEHWEVDQDVKEQWNAQVAEKTPLTPDELVDGAVDVTWFSEVYQSLKKAKWTIVLKAAKFASSSGGHKRAELFANAMLKQITKTDITKRIKSKRHQDSVRALGLLPLATGKSRENDLLLRYELFKEFTRVSKKFGSQRQASEKRCAQIGTENLARTAGYADPIRLEWAMEGKSLEDLKSGSITETDADVTVSLSITKLGEPEISINRAGKPLKAIPAKLKKLPKFKALTERKTKLKKQISRMRQSLEEMMCSQEPFTAEEIKTFSQHPLLARFTSNLLFTHDNTVGRITNTGNALFTHNNSTIPLKPTDLLTISHPTQLFLSKQWSYWQKYCFEHQWIQPFKQVFREYYPISDAEKSDLTNRSSRYAGHQVNPRQALALLGSRGWLNVPEEGVRKVYHKEGICAWIDFEEYFYTPAELEGLTLANVYFFTKNNPKIIPLDQVPPHIFSEAMRDLDLVVSVAHQGGVDPEATQSTIQMRAALAAETCQMLNLANVSFKDTHAIIHGDLAKYTIHLGSTIVHTLPGGAIFLVAIQSQHRGRIFLPFADNDPKTAELLSKIIMLSRDKQIKDPGLLAQIKP
ncbi:MAG: DUF5724 domain-containing protein [Akkermansiaceae bacterium]